MTTETELTGLHIETSGGILTKPSGGQPGNQRGRDFSIPGVLESRERGKGAGGANSDDWRESVALCILRARNSLRNGFHILQEDLLASALSKILLNHI